MAEANSPNLSSRRASKEEFSQMVCAKLEHYVYALLDPRKTGPKKDRIFYIGKGTGNRCFDHAKAEMKKREEPLDEKEHKLRMIREILEDKKKVDVFIVKHGLESEGEAMALEAVLIGLLELTNKVGGQGGKDLWLNENEIKERHDTPIQRCDAEVFRRNILFVSLNRQDVEALENEGSKDQLAEATLGDWALSEENSKKVDFIVGVKNSLIVSILEVDKAADGASKFVRIPPSKSRAKGRSRFHASRMPKLEEKFAGRSVHYGGQVISRMPMGAGFRFVRELVPSTVSR